MVCHVYLHNEHHKFAMADIQERRHKYKNEATSLNIEILVCLDAKLKHPGHKSARPIRSNLVNRCVVFPILMCIRNNNDNHSHSILEII